MVKNIKENTSLNYDSRLREFLMTTFLVIIVYELISKVFWSYIFWLLNNCNAQNILTTKSIDVIELSEYIWNSIKCSILKIVNTFPDWFFSTIPWADTNLLITLYSLFTTWILIWIVYKIAKFIYKHEDIKNYMQWEWRKWFYTDEFWALLLLTFIIFGVLIMILYPIFWIVFLFMIMKVIFDKRNIK